MLVAELYGKRIEARVAAKGPNYVCPSCKEVLILKKGRKVIHHFAHKASTNCSWAKGETLAHRKAKNVVAEALSLRGIEAHVEFQVETLTGDRRADVMAFSPNGSRYAFELQHTSISLSEIERRALSYANAGIAQIWIPFLRNSVWENGNSAPQGWFVERYSPQLFERWIHGLNQKRGMWMYAPNKQEFWLGKLEDHLIYKPETSWYSEYGEEQTAGGYERVSKRYKELNLIGPYSISELLVTSFVRRVGSVAAYNWPAGRIAYFVMPTRG